MSAPENIDPEGYTDMGCGCGRLYSYGGHVEPGQHDQDCPVSLSLALARLQARWDARTEQLRALITQWRAHPGSQHHTGTTVGSYAAGRIDSADELERAIGGDRD